MQIRPLTQRWQWENFHHHIHRDPRSFCGLNANQNACLRCSKLAGSQSTGKKLKSCKRNIMRRNVGLLCFFSPSCQIGLILLHLTHNFSLTADLRKKKNFTVWAMCPKKRTQSSPFAIMIWLMLPNTLTTPWKMFRFCRVVCRRHNPRRWLVLPSWWFVSVSCMFGVDGDKLKGRVRSELIFYPLITRPEVDRGSPDIF